MAGLTHAAFLRGVNLGSTRKTSSADLRACFEAAGFGEVRTFRTSGNVVLDAGREPAKRLAGRLEAALLDSFGFEVQVFLRTAAQVRAIADHQPFPASVTEGAGGKLQVALLSQAPSASARKRILALSTDADPLALDGRELYWQPSGLMRDSELNLRELEKLTGPWTMRTKGTLELLAAKFFGAR